MADDWSHLDDYDAPGAEWLDVTQVGSAYEQQCDVGEAAGRENRWRHRHVFTKGPWKRGTAPK